MQDYVHPARPWLHEPRPYANGQGLCGFHTIQVCGPWASPFLSLFRCTIRYLLYPVGPGIPNRSYVFAGRGVNVSRCPVLYILHKPCPPPVGWVCRINYMFMILGPQCTRLAWSWRYESKRNLNGTAILGFPLYARGGIAQRDRCLCSQPGGS